ncbi:NAD(P)H-quinone oxidoreductase [Oryzicola mucosus]|uniref:NAD(P)H-quinone oxidoreductase n=1 Tax=Oryzicola mucosus TaxID=2767425 RepID=A0A8J6U5X9_9HYPH|nr:NAD(P)H-quinone oxidoreductase [Oryzicola mucosus]MBD0417205.1 NAD(P)H-quinone oxidoreductase [Oryzicola mucosus]
MRAVLFDAPGGPDVLYVGRADIPKAGPGEVVIAVRAAGVNRPDIAQRLGRYPVPKDASPLLGLEVAGDVVEIGAGTEMFSLGDRVMALVHGGGYAEFCRAHARLVMSIPPDLSYTEAAGFPEAAMTVEFNMIMRAGLEAGDIVLIHGGSSGIGSHAIARAHALGAVPITTSRGAAKAEYCRRIGAALAIDTTSAEWTGEVMRQMKGRGVDVVLDMVGGDYTDRNIACMAEDGRYALISLQGGSRAEIDLEPILRRRLMLVGSTLRPLPLATKAGVVEHLKSHVLPRLAGGEMRPRIHATFALEDVAEAHRLLERNEHFGKIILTNPGPS